MSKVIREIYTKAVVAKGNIDSVETYSLTLDNPVESVLGCWIVNHEYSAYIKGENVYLDGSFDINLWYAGKENNKSDVFLEKKEYSGQFVITKKDVEYFKESYNISVLCNLEPHCMRAYVKEDMIVDVMIEKKFTCDVLGEVFLKIETIEDDLEIANLEFDINENFLNE